MTPQEEGEAAFAARLKFAIKEPALLTLDMSDKNDLFKALPDHHKAILAELTIGQVGAIKHLVRSVLDVTIDSVGADFSDEPDGFEIRYKGTRIFEEI